MQFRSKKKKKVIRIKPRFFVILGVLAILAALLLFKVSGAIGGGGEEKKSDAPQQKTEQQAEKKDDNKRAGTKTLDITVGGDLVIHEPVYRAAKTDDGYDFTPPFEYVKEYIEDADLATCTFEGSLVDSDFTGYPSFRTPKQLPTSLKKLGFDAVSVTSNHAVDGGEEGFNSTVKAVKDAGLESMGGKENADDPDYVICESKGAKVAFVSYSYSEGTNDQPTLNGGLVTENMKPCVNIFHMDDKEGSLARMAETEKAARDAGADVVILVLHWGTEYWRNADDDQKKLAQMLADGTTYDAIIGSHPHVVQEQTVLRAKDGRSVPCYYAIGNLFSNQRRELVNDNKFVEQGIIVLLKIDYDFDSEKVTNIKTENIPYWVDKIIKEGVEDGTEKAEFKIIPLTDGYENNGFLVQSGHLNLAKDAKKELDKILSESGKSSDEDASKNTNDSGDNASENASDGGEGGAESDSSSSENNE